MRISKILTLSVFFLALFPVCAYGAAYSERQVSIAISGEDLAGCKLELCEFPGNKRLALTTSWDDGSNPEWDLRMARLHEKHGWKGTFFWPLWAKAISETEPILETGMEIATHSATHPHMTTKSPNRMFWEFMASSVFLGTMTDSPVVSYSDPFCSRDGLVDREFYRTNLLSARTCANGSETYSVLDFGKRHALPSMMLFPGKSKGEEAEKRLEKLVASCPMGTIQSLWGHVRLPEFGEEKWKRADEIFAKFSHKKDIWYATYAEIGSYTFLREKAALGEQEISGNTLNCDLHLGKLPRDIVPVPISLRLTGPKEKLKKIESVTVDGAPTEFLIRDGIVFFDVSSVTRDLRPTRITSEIVGSSSHSYVKKATSRVLTTTSIYMAPKKPVGLKAVWAWTSKGDKKYVDVKIQNVSEKAITDLAFELLTASVWGVDLQENAPRDELGPEEKFEASCVISPVEGANVAGQTAFVGRIDYVIDGQSCTHYLWNGFETPVDPKLAAREIARNVVVAGPSVAGADDNAEKRFVSLEHDPNDRLNYINLKGLYLPKDGPSKKGPCVVASEILAEKDMEVEIDIETQGMLLTDIRLNGKTVGESGVRRVVSLPVDLRKGVNRLEITCEPRPNLKFYMLVGMFASIRDRSSADNAGISYKNK